MYDWENRVTTTPPKGLLEWCKEKYLRTGYLIYRAGKYYDPLEDRNKKCADVTCTSCGSTWKADYVSHDGCGRYAPAPFGYWSTATAEAVIQGSTDICPMCAAESKVVHIGRISTGGSFADECWPMTMDCIDGCFVLIGWHCGRYLYKDDHTSVGHEEILLRPYEAYVLENRRMVRLCAVQKYFTAVTFLNEWHQRKRWSDEWGDQFEMYGDVKKAIANTNAENSRLDLYMESEGKRFPVSYLKLWQKHPAVENLLVQGCGNLLNEIMNHHTTCTGYYGNRAYISVNGIGEINWKEKRPSSMLGLNRYEFNRMKSERWDMTDIAIYKKARLQGDNAANSDIKLIKKHISCFSGDLVNMDINLVKTARYLDKQKRKYNEGDIYLLRDYWGMAEPDAERWPQHLKSAHDAALMHKKFKESKALMQGFSEQAERLSVYTWEHDGILIRPAQTESELIKEGKMLNHCVATYAKQHAKGKSVIFFVRRVDDPDRPWYTLNLNTESMTVIQNRGNRNCDRTPEVEHFEKAWLEHIKTIDRRKTA